MRRATKRIVACGMAGIVAGALVPLLAVDLASSPVDFLWTQFAVRDWKAGRDVYARPAHVNCIPYPFTAVVIAWPFSVLPMKVAASVFVALGVGVLSWALTRGDESEWWRLLALGSSSSYVAIKCVQWSPWLTASLVYPGLAWIWAAKPTFAVFALCHVPSRAAVGVAIAIVAVSLVLQPSWPSAWLPRTSAYNGFVPAMGSRTPEVLSLPSPWLLVAIVRWSDPRARLIAVMAVMPQHIYFYDQLPLYLVPRSPREMLFLLVCGWVGVSLAHELGFEYASVLLILMLYLPAFLLLFRDEATMLVQSCVNRIGVSMHRC